MFKKTILSIAFILFTLILPACDNDYKISNISLGAERDKKTSLITTPQTVFEPDTSIIYGQATFTNPETKENTTLQIIWNYIKDGEDVPVNSNNITTNQGGTIGFQSKRPGYNWQTGKYRIDFIIKEKTYATYEFTVGNTGIQNQYISSLETASKVDSAHNPTTITDTFSPTAQEIYLTLATTKEAPKNLSVKVEWYYVSDSQKLNEATTTVGPNQKTHFTLDKQHNQTFLLPNGNWPSGNYRADIYLNQEKLDTSVRFEIK